MSNQLAVVTGASSGIGYNLAKVFAENGFDLVIASKGQRLEDADAISSLSMFTSLRFMPISPPTTASPNSGKRLNPWAGPWTRSPSMPVSA